MRPRLKDNQLLAGNRFAVRLERTLRVPNDGRQYPLPPSFGPFPVYRTRDYPKLRDMAGRGEFFVPLYQWEAMWLRFEAEDWKPNAVQAAAGGVNVLTGKPFPSRLSANPQNYLVCPLQPWLDGVKTGEGQVSQFVAAPPGQNMTVEEQLAGESSRGGLQIRVFEPKPGIFPARRPRGFFRHGLLSEMIAAIGSAELGLAGGGRIEQKVYPDPHGVRTWDPENYCDITILIVNSSEFRALTGAPPPPSPISAKQYQQYGLPWFRLYDEDLADTGDGGRLKQLKTVTLDDPSVSAKPVRGIRRKHDQKRRSRRGKP